MSLLVDIEKELGSFRLRVKLEIENEVLGLLGASGCGKSMTLKCIAGIEKPDRGRIVLNGKALFDAERRINLAPQKRRVAYLFQQYALFPNMTVTRNIAAGVRNKAEREDRVREILRAMDLTGLEDRKPAQLSGGQQQRVALARILVNDPDVILLDEPFSALDTDLRLSTEQETRRVIAAAGKPTIFVSHDRAEILRLSDRVCRMEDGQLSGILPRKDAVPLVLGRDAVETELTVDGTPRKVWLAADSVIFTEEETP